MINMVLSSASVRVCLALNLSKLDLCSGPNELSIINVELITYILGPQGLPKGPSKINSHVNAVSVDLVSFTSVGRKTITDVTEQRPVKT